MDILELERQVRLAYGQTEHLQALVQDAMAADSQNLGKIHLLQAWLAQMQRRHEERHQFLVQAIHWARERSDTEIESVALAETALPLGHDLTNDERVSAGRRALRLARSTGHDALIAKALSNLAYARVYSGDDKALRLFSEAAAMAEVAHRDQVAPFCWNWAAAAFAIGNYTEARKAVTRAETWEVGREAAQMNRAYRALLAYRIGKWDEALEHLSKVEKPPRLAGFLPAAQVAIQLERFTQPDLVALETRIREMHTPLHWLPFSAAVLAEARMIRREPFASTGVEEILREVMTSGRRIGWDELLIICAKSGRALWEASQALIIHVPPAGWRAEGCRLSAAAIKTEASSDACDLFLEASRMFERGGDQYPRAIALKSAAETMFDAGRPPGSCNREAAEMLSEIGAWRSVAELLRRNRGNSALRHIKLPPQMRHMRAPGLTRREFLVANLAADGLSSRQIAQELGLSPRTVEAHIDRIRTKLGLERKSDLVRLRHRR